MSDWISREVLETVPCDEPIKRFEDMSRNGFISLIRQDDGDMCIMVFDEKNESISTIEFTTSGGQSKNTLAALYNLAYAIIKDNKEHEQRRD